MTGSEAKRIMGVGSGTLAQKRLTHADPFEPEQPKPAPDLETDADAWARSVKGWLSGPGHP